MCGSKTIAAPVLQQSDSETAVRKLQDRIVHRDNEISKEKD